MMVHRKACLCLAWALCLCSLAAVITEDSASANALSGITLLSSAVSDYQLSPLIGSTGASLSYVRPFNIGVASVYSLNSAVRISPLLLSYGASYLDQGDYLWQDIRLGLAAGCKGFKLGLAEHLLYEKISTEDSYHSWTTDLALAWKGAAYAGELRWLHLGAADAQLHCSASSNVTADISIAADYVYAPRGEDSFRVGTSCAIGEFISVQSSWQNAPARFGAGISLQYGAGELCYAIRTHTELSLTHSLDLGFRW